MHKLHDLNGPAGVFMPGALYYCRSVCRWRLIFQQRRWRDLGAVAHRLSGLTVTVSIPAAGSRYGCLSAPFPHNNIDCFAALSGGFMTLIITHFIMFWKSVSLVDEEVIVRIWAVARHIPENSRTGPLRLAATGSHLLCDLLSNDFSRSGGPPLFAALAGWRGAY